MANRFGVTGQFGTTAPNVPTVILNNTPKQSEIVRNFSMLDSTTRHLWVGSQFETSVQFFNKCTNDPQTTLNYTRSSVCLMCVTSSVPESHISVHFVQLFLSCQNFKGTVRTQNDLEDIKCKLPRALRLALRPAVFEIRFPNIANASNELRVTLNT